MARAAGRRDGRRRLVLRDGDAGRGRRQRAPRADVRRRRAAREHGAARAGPRSRVRVPVCWSAAADQGCNRLTGASGGHPVTGKGENLTKRIRMLFRFVLIALLLFPATSLAQQSSAIAGTVRDTSGALMPGVTVEASSPALI